jgi:hypothetical protein
MKLLLHILPAIVACTAMLAGCNPAEEEKKIQVTFTYATMGPQSHYDFPNSNVKPLGLVKVTHMRFEHDSPMSEDHLALYNAALTQIQGANLIIDYIKVVRTFERDKNGKSQGCEMDIEGTAAKMEVGTQKIGP